MKIRKIGAAALAAALMTGTAVTAFANEEPELLFDGDYDMMGYYSIDGLRFGRHARGNLYIVAPLPDKNADYVDVVFPESEKLYDVTPEDLLEYGIQYEMSFIDCPNLESVTIPNTVSVAFSVKSFSNCPNLKSITFGSNTYFNVKENVYGDNDGKIFDNCPNLTDIYFTGTEEQWNEIYIDAPIDYSSSTINFERKMGDEGSLELVGLSQDVTVHFNSAAPEVKDDTTTDGITTEDTTTDDTKSDDNKTDNKTDNKNNVDTGANGIALMVGTAALAGAAVVIYRKKK